MGDKSQDHTHIMSSLEKIKEPYDEVLGKIEGEDSRHRNTSFTWLIKPFLYSLGDLRTLTDKEIDSFFTKFVSSPLFTAIGIGGIITTKTLEELSEYGILAIYITITLYIISVIINFRRQTKIEDPYFDISAFRMTNNFFFRKIAQQYIAAQPFSFTQTYNYFRDVLARSFDELKENKKIISDIHARLQEHQEKEKKYEEREKELLNHISVQKNAIDQSGKALESAKSVLDSNRKLLNHLNKSIIRGAQGDFDKDDLMLGYDYSLFQEDEHGDLIRVDSHGLTSTPKKLRTDLPTEEGEFAVIHAYEDEEGEFAVIHAYEDEEENLYEDISHQRVILSKRFTMSDGTIYVYSYHFNNYQTDNNYDIIKTEEMFSSLYSLITFWHNEYGNPPREAVEHE